MSDDAPARLRAARDGPERAAAEFPAGLDEADRVLGAHEPRAWAGARRTAALTFLPPSPAKPLPETAAGTPRPTAFVRRRKQLARAARAGDEAAVVDAPVALADEDIPIPWIGRLAHVETLLDIHDHVGIAERMALWRKHESP